MSHHAILREERKVAFLDAGFAGHQREHQVEEAPSVDDRACSVRRKPCTSTSQCWEVGLCFATLAAETVSDEAHMHFGGQVRNAKQQQGPCRAQSELALQ